VAINNVLFLAHRDSVAETQVISFMQQTFLLNAQKGQKTLGDCSEKKLLEFAKGWDKYLEQIRTMPTGEA
jgi:hypothetical protein